MMNPIARQQEIFAQAIHLEGEARVQYLTEACADNAALRAEVEALLAAASGASDAGFLASPTHDRHAGTVHAAITEGPGTRIGLYKLLQLIGEGGFGSVFMAEQDKPVRRRVALKIIKLGMDTKQVIARFEAERQALALMEHPHIARVLDGGATDTGRPYFVMEYVTGDPITAFADAHKLALSDRMTLFMQVCQAVQHAHTKGIIHRDLKPTNILVSMVDGKPFAKVIDFGIAKATGARLTEKTLFTEHRQLIGTPEYMSPEQAEGSPDIDTRTDVYALGVLLYELLSGATPFDAERLRSAAFAELQRIIRDEEPPMPSVRLSRSLETLASIAAARKSEPARLGTLIRGELDWIVMKSLEKERARRYETPSALAADVDRHLSGEPVVAAPPSAAYRLRKFVRKHRGKVLAGGAVAVALVIGIATTSIALLIAQHNADAAWNNARIAEKATSELKTANATLESANSAARDALAWVLSELYPDSGAFGVKSEIFADRPDGARGIRIAPNDAGDDSHRWIVTPIKPDGSEDADSRAIFETMADFAVENIRQTRELNSRLEASNKMLLAEAEKSLDEIAFSGEVNVDASSRWERAAHLFQEVLGPNDPRTREAEFWTEVTRKDCAFTQSDLEHLDKMIEKYKEVAGIDAVDAMYWGVAMHLQQQERMREALEWARKRTDKFERWSASVSLVNAALWEYLPRIATSEAATALDEDGRAHLLAELKAMRAAFERHPNVDLAVGLWYFRYGDSATAYDLLSTETLRVRFEGVDIESNDCSPVERLAVLTMCAAKLNKPEEARTYLEQLRSWISDPANAETMASPSFETAKALLAEAEALIEPASKTPTEPAATSSP